MKFFILVVLSSLMPFLANAEVHCSGIAESVCDGSPSRPCPDHINNIFSEGQEVEPSQDEAVI